MSPMRQKYALDLTAADREPSVCGLRMTVKRTEPTLYFFLPFAGAAFLRSCGTTILLSQNRSPIRSFAGVDFPRTKNALSPQPGQTFETRDAAAFCKRSYRPPAPETIVPMASRPIMH